MNDRVEKVKAGVFVLVSMVLLVVIVFLVAGLQVLKSSKTYYVHFQESVTGLEESSTVRYQGVPVGRVANIGFAKDDIHVIEVTIEVEPEFPLRVDTDAKLKPQGITGIYYIDLYGGSPEKPPLPEGGVLQASHSISVQLEETLSNLGSVVKRVNEFFEENREQLSGLLADARETVRAGKETLARLDRALEGATDLTTSLRGKLERIADTAQSSLAAVESFASNPATQAIPGKVDAFLDRANAIADTAEARLADLDMRGLVEQTKETLARVEVVAEETRGMITEAQAGVVENRGALTRALADFESFAQQLKMLAKEIREQPSRLILGRPRQGRRDVR